MEKSRHSRAAIGSADNNNGVVIKFLDRTSSGNSWKVVTVDPGEANSPLLISTSLQEKTITVRLKTDSQKEILTTAKTLVETFSGNAQSEGYDVVASGGTLPKSSKPSIEAHCVAQNCIFSNAFAFNALASVIAKQRLSCVWCKAAINKSSLFLK